VKLPRWITVSLAASPFGDLVYAAPSP
jgi:hypothetical protein